MAVRGLAGILAIGSAVVTGICLSVHPNLAYNDFEIECNSVIGAGNVPGSVRDSGSGPVGFSVVSGEGAIDDLEKKAWDNGIKDPFYITANLERDCTDHRVTLVAWGALSAAATALCAVIAVNRRPARPGSRPT